MFPLVGWSVGYLAKKKKKMLTNAIMKRKHTNIRKNIRVDGVVVSAVLSCAIVVWLRMFACYASLFYGYPVQLWHNVTTMHA